MKRTITLAVRAIAVTSAVLLSACSDPAGPLPIEPIVDPNATVTAPKVMENSAAPIRHGFRNP